MADVRKLIIVGSGPAGLTAAIYSSRAQLSPLVFAGPEPGGQLTLTSEVEDFPGFPDGILGPELMERMKAQAEKFGTEYKTESVTAVDMSVRPFVVTTEAGTYSTESLIIATGASAKWLGLPSEQKLIGHGVSSCAVCDGFFFRGKDVIVVGGGDAAFKEALYLAKLAKNVTVVHRRDEFRAQKILQERARTTPNIAFRMNAVVEEVLGEGIVAGVRIKKDDGTVEDLSAQGVFVAIGHNPNTKPFVGSVNLDNAGFVLSDDGVHVNVPGVFVAGDVYDKKYRQAVTAAGAGCAAAMEAEEYLAGISNIVTD